MQLNLSFWIDAQDGIPDLLSFALTNRVREAGDLAVHVRRCIDIMLVEHKMLQTTARQNCRHRSANAPHANDDNFSRSNPRLLVCRKYTVIALK